MDLRSLVLCLCVLGADQSPATFMDYDYGGVPITINRMLGEPSVMSLRGRIDAGWLRTVNPQSCPLECECPIQWPSALYCDNRGLRYVPPTLPPRTEYLFLQGNRISGLPAGVFSNTSLVRWLFLDHNQLASDQVASMTLAQLPRLKNLFLNHNNLTDIPSRLPGGLKQLRLAHNKIAKISPEAFGNLHNLTVLLLHGNQLKTIGEADFKGLHSIILLDLSHNHLEEFPKNLPPSVRQLYVSNNSLSALPAGCLAGFDSLEYLRISHNGLQDKGIAEGVFNVSSIVELDLSYNQLTSIPLVPESLQYLYLEANLIQEFNVTSFCRSVSPLRFSRMRILRLDGNRLSYHQLPPNWVQCLRVLRAIYV
ncbi:lumican [Amia ocellicauda]|uniref:lumican n=1 Tax=Amia ocellicauda TaxID=2972642 RepID=UPI003463A9C0